MIIMYQVVQFLDLVKVAQDDLKAARNKAEQVGLPECAEAIDGVIGSFVTALAILNEYEVKRIKQ